MRIVGLQSPPETSETPARPPRRGGAGVFSSHPRGQRGAITRSGAKPSEAGDHVNQQPAKEQGEDDPPPRPRSRLIPDPKPGPDVLRQSITGGFVEECGSLNGDEEEKPEDPRPSEYAHFCSLRVRYPVNQGIPPANNTPAASNADS